MGLWTLVGCLFLVGCDAAGSDGDETNDFQQGDVDGDGTVDIVGDPDQTLTGNLADGAVIDLGWADDSAVACFPGTENNNFDGNHVLFTGVSKQGSAHLFVQADPESGVDISLYVLEFPASGEQIPPEVTSASRCEASFDDQGTGNPGRAEVVGPLLGFGDRTMLIGVAGANGATTGAFSVGIWRLDGGTMDTGGE